MKAAIIVSKKDAAGMNIREQLLKLGFAGAGLFRGNETFSATAIGSELFLYTVEEDSIYCEGIDSEIDCDVFIFATKHKSSSGRKSLTVHIQGNWGKAEMGGRERALCTAAAPLLKQGLRQLRSTRLDYEVVQEVTHHGPYIEKPSMFIEIGSSEAEWKDEEAGKEIAAAIMKLFEADLSCRSAVGIGGLHYATNFREIQLDSKVAIGHICPKYALGELDAEMLRQAVERTWPKKADLVILDWKGLGEHKEKVKKLLEELGIESKRTSELKKHNI